MRLTISRVLLSRIFDSQIRLGQLSRIISMSAVDMNARSARSPGKDGTISSYNSSRVKEFRLFCRQLNMIRIGTAHQTSCKHSIEVCRRRKSQRLYNGSVLVVSSDTLGYWTDRVFNCVLCEDKAAKRLDVLDLVVHVSS